MRAAQGNRVGHHREEGQVSVTQSFLNTFSRLSEVIWLCITFLLFIVLGPFSVIAVIYGLWALATDERTENLIEPARC